MELVFLTFVNLYLSLCSYNSNSLNIFIPNPLGFQFIGPNT